MCDIWRNPTHLRREVTPRTLEKLPSGIDYLNLTGGEPTLRKDLAEICDILRPKAATLEISTNGLIPEPLEAIVRKHPDIKVRVSLEGLGETNDRIRGEPNGYEKKMETMRRLIAAGGCDLGFATTIQDENIDQLADLFRLAEGMGVELATSALHNGFQFHKNDNCVYDRLGVARKIESLITAMLGTWSVKTWFRAYLNLGLIAKVLGHDRLLPCCAGSDFAFVDPWSDVYACNVRPDLWMGNLERQTWEEICRGEEAQRAREAVCACPQNCWMVASAKTAMRIRRLPRLPRPGPLLWVVGNKLRVTCGLPVRFDRYIDYASVYRDEKIVRRESFLGKRCERVLQGDRPPYERYGPYHNR